MSIRSFDRENRAREAAPTPEPKSNLGAVLSRVARLAILLGLVMEVLILIMSGFGDLRSVGEEKLSYTRVLIRWGGEWRRAATHVALSSSSLTPGGDVTLNGVSR